MKGKRLFVPLDTNPKVSPSYQEKVDEFKERQKKIIKKHGVKLPQ